jgi:surface polysaccharide O-acyltransferase-like enzyme
MSRKLLSLTGLSILAVVLNHASGFGFIALFWWTNRYRPVAVPNFDQLWTAIFCVLLVIREITLFSVPAFLFVSGYFIAYAFHPNITKKGYETIKPRIMNLLIPYLIWSIIIFVFSYILIGDKLNLSEYIVRLVLGRATDPYFYIPIILQLYLLAPILVRLAINNWKRLLIISIILRIFVVVWNYLSFIPNMKVNSPPSVLFIGWTIYFILGVLYGYYPERFKLWLSRNKSNLPFWMFFFAVLMIIETVFLFSRNNNFDWIGNQYLFSVTIFAILFIFWYISIERLGAAFRKILFVLGEHVYGIYLIHPIVLTYISKFLYHIAPKILAVQVLYQSILVVSGLLIPLIFMHFFSESRFRRYYRYIFG